MDGLMIIACIGRQFLGRIHENKTQKSICLHITSLNQSTALDSATTKNIKISLFAFFLI